MIYFDNAATTMPNKEVLDVYQKVAKTIWYNPSGMYKESVLAKNYINKAKSTILKTLNINNKEIIFTSGATEANNTAIFSVCNKYIGMNKHIITTSIEHASVYNCFKYLEQMGFRVTYLKCNGGIVDLEELKNALTKDTILVSIMWVNNIIGSIQPIEEINSIVKKYSHAKLHVDAVQGIGKIPFDFDPNKVDYLSLTLHKIEGLKGTGLLFIPNNVQIEPYIKGGHQQNNMRAGTMDVAGAVAASKAISIAYQNLNSHYNYVQELANYLLGKINKLSFITINRDKGSYSPFVISFSFNNLKGETAMHYLEKANICVGIGSACNEKTQTLERAIMVLTDDEKRAINMIRISLSHLNTKEEIDILIEKLKELERI